MICESGIKPCHSQLQPEHSVWRRWSYKRMPKDLMTMYDQTKHMFPISTCQTYNRMLVCPTHAAQTHKPNTFTQMQNTGFPSCVNHLYSTRSKGLQTNTLYNIACFEAQQCTLLSHPHPGFKLYTSKLEFSNPQKQLCRVFFRSLIWNLTGG